MVFSAVLIAQLPHIKLLFHLFTVHICRLDTILKCIFVTENRDWKLIRNWTVIRRDRYSKVC